MEDGAVDGPGAADANISRAVSGCIHLNINRTLCACVKALRVEAQGNLYLLKMWS